MDLNAFYEAEFDELKAVLEATRGALEREFGLI